MNIRSKLIYKQHLIKRETGNRSIVYELLLPMLFFGSIGAITWAIRGTAGWGGVDGTVIPGLTWGVLWYYLAFRKGIDARGIILWLGLGIALGGELGYGQYTSWIRGIFYVGNGTISIKPWLGYFWFAMCGIGWAAPGGILLGWALGKRVSIQIWIIRSFMLTILLVLLFAWPFIDWLGEILLKTNSGVLFPNADLGIYNGELGEHLSQTVYTNTQNFAVVIWWIVALFMAVLQKDKVTKIIGIIIGGGFGPGFMQSAAWTLGYGIAPDYIDWWKIWELNSGFNLGVLYALALFWAIRHFDTTHILDNTSNENKVKRPKSTQWRDTLFLAFSGFVLLFFVGFEYFFRTGLALSIFYFVTICLTTIGNSELNLLNEKRKNVSLIFSIFFLVFILFHGGSERFGIVFNLYELDEVSQYSWPINRILVFVPAAIIITGTTLFQMWKVLQVDTIQKLAEFKTSKFSIRINDLITLIGFIGILTIWPAKISVFYALFLVLAIFAFNRLEYWFNKVDNQLK